MMSKVELEDWVKVLAVEAFGSDIVQGVDCRRGEDHTGDAVIWTTILVHNGRGAIGAAKTLPFNSRLVQAFRHAGEAYPILSYVPISEFKGAYPAAA